MESMRQTRPNRVTIIACMETRDDDAQGRSTILRDLDAAKERCRREGNGPSRKNPSSEPPEEIEGSALMDNVASGGCPNEL